MRKRTFTKPIALLLSGAMLFGVGCKDYDDDIDSINNKLEQMEGKVALKTDLTAINASISALEQINFDTLAQKVQDKIDASLANYAKKSDLKAWLTSDEVNSLITGKGYQTKSDVEDLLKDYAKTSQLPDMEKVLQNLMTSADMWKGLSADVAAAIKAKMSLSEFMTGESALSSNQQADAVAAVVAALNDETSEFCKSLTTWLGEQMTTYLEPYVKSSELLASVTGGLMDEMTKADSDYKNVLIKLIKDNTEKPDLTTYLQKTDLETAYGTYQETIAALEGRIAALEGRIQSLVYVPKSVSEVAEKFIEFGGTKYVEFGKTKVILSTAEKNEVLTFKVTPAALAEKFTKENTKFAVEMVENDWYMYSRALPDDYYKVESVVAEKDAAGNCTGKIAIEVSTTYDYSEYEGKLPALALHVTIPVVDGDKTTENIDYQTSYYMAMADAENIASNLEVAIKDGDKYVTNFDERLLYTNTDKFNFFEKAKLYYVEEIWNPETRQYDYKYYDAIEKYPALADLYDVTYAVPQINGDEANYTVATEDEGNGWFNIKKSSTDLIGNTVATSAVFGLVNGEDFYAINNFDQTVTIIGEEINATAKTAAAFTWNYTAASTNKQYRANKLELKSDLTAAEFNEFAIQYVAFYDAEGKMIDGFRAGINKASEPTLNSDAQIINVILLGNLDADCKLAKIVYKGTQSNGNMPVITVPVTIDPMPVVADITVGEAAALSADRTYTVAEKFADKAWNEAWAKKYFTDKAQFEAMLYAAGEESTIGETDPANIVTAFGKNGQNIEIAYSDKVAYGKVYEAKAKYTDAATGFNVTFVNGASVTDPAAALNQTPAYFIDGVAKATWTLAGGVLTVNDKPLANAYKTTLKGGVITYSLDYTDEDLVAGTIENGTTPEIDADGVLAWNDWTKLSIKVKAELSLGGKVIAHANFTVAIDNPVAEKITVSKGAAEISLAKGKTFDVVSKLSLKTTDTPAQEIFKSGAANGLDADLKAALSATAKFEAATLKNCDETDFTIDEATGVVEWTSTSALTIQKYPVITVKATYTDKFGNTRTESVDVTVKD